MAVYHASQDSHYIKGQAIFSTNDSRRMAQNAVPNRPMVVRSDLFADCRDYAYRIRQLHREKCGRVAMDSPVADFFDPHDINVYGLDFCSTVIARLAFENKFQSFAIGWVEQNKHCTERLQLIGQATHIEELFSNQDFLEHGAPVLEAALKFLKEGFCILLDQQVPEGRVSSPMSADVQASQPEQAIAAVHPNAQVVLGPPQLTDLVAGPSRPINENLISQAIDQAPAAPLKPQISQGNTQQPPAVVESRKMKKQRPPAAQRPPQSQLQQNTGPHADRRARDFALSVPPAQASTTRQPSQTMPMERSVSDVGSAPDGLRFHHLDMLQLRRLGEIRQEPKAPSGSRPPSSRSVSSVPPSVRASPSFSVMQPLPPREPSGRFSPAAGPYSHLATPQVSHNTQVTGTFPSEVQMLGPLQPNVAQQTTQPPQVAIVPQQLPRETFADTVHGHVLRSQLYPRGALVPSAQEFAAQMGQAPPTTDANVQGALALPTAFGPPGFQSGFPILPPQVIPCGQQPPFMPMPVDPMLQQPQPQPQPQRPVRSQRVSVEGRGRGRYGRGRGGNFAGSHDRRMSQNVPPARESADAPFIAPSRYFSNRFQENEPSFSAPPPYTFVQLPQGQKQTEPFPGFENHQPASVPGPIEPGQRVTIHDIGEDVEHVRSLWTGNLAPVTTADHVKALFEEADIVVKEIKPVKQDGRPRPLGFTFVEFHSTADARRALAQNGRELNGFQITIQCNRHDVNYGDVPNPGRKNTNGTFGHGPDPSSPERFRRGSNYTAPYTGSRSRTNTIIENPESYSPQDARSGTAHAGGAFVSPFDTGSPETKRNIKGKGKKSGVWVPQPAGPTNALVTDTEVVPTKKSSMEDAAPPRAEGSPSRWGKRNKNIKSRVKSRDETSAEHTGEAEGPVNLDPSTTGISENIANSRTANPDQKVPWSTEKTIVTAQQVDETSAATKPEPEPEAVPTQEPDVPEVSSSSVTEQPQMTAEATVEVVPSSKSVIDERKNAAHDNIGSNEPIAPFVSTEKSEQDENIPGPSIDKWHDLTQDVARQETSAEIELPSGGKWISFGEMPKVRLDKHVGSRTSSASCPPPPIPKIPAGTRSRSIAASDDAKSLSTGSEPMSPKTTKTFEDVDPAVGDKGKAPASETEVASVPSANAVDVQILNNQSENVVSEPADTPGVLETTPDLTQAHHFERKFDQSSETTHQPEGHFDTASAVEEPAGTQTSKALQPSRNTVSIHPVAAQKAAKKQAQQAKKKEKKKAKLEATKASEAKPSSPGAPVGLADITNVANTTASEVLAAQAKKDSVADRSFLEVAEAGKSTGEHYDVDSQNSAQVLGKENLHMDTAADLNHPQESKEGIGPAVGPAQRQRTTLFSRVSGAVPILLGLRRKPSNNTLQVEESKLKEVNEAGKETIDETVHAAKQPAKQVQPPMTLTTPTKGRISSLATDSPSEFTDASTNSPDSVADLTKTTPGAYPEHPKAPKPHLQKTKTKGQPSSLLTIASPVMAPSPAQEKEAADNKERDCPPSRDGGSSQGMTLSSSPSKDVKILTPSSTTALEGQADTSSTMGYPSSPRGDMVLSVPKKKKKKRPKKKKNEASTDEHDGQIEALEALIDEQEAANQKQKADVLHLAAEVLSMRDKASKLGALVQGEALSTQTASQRASETTERKETRYAIAKPTEPFYPRGTRAAEESRKPEATQTDPNDKKDLLRAYMESFTYKQIDLALENGDRQLALSLCLNVANMTEWRKKDPNARYPNFAAIQMLDPDARQVLKDRVEGVIDTLVDPCRTFCLDVVHAQAMAEKLIESQVAKAMATPGPSEEEIKDIAQEEGQKKKIDQYLKSAKAGQTGMLFIEGVSACFWAIKTGQDPTLDSSRQIQEVTDDDTNEGEIDTLNRLREEAQTPETENDLQWANNGTNVEDEGQEYDDVPDQSSLGYEQSPEYWAGKDSRVEDYSTRRKVYEEVRNQTMDRARDPRVEKNPTNMHNPDMSSLMQKNEVKIWHNDIFKEWQAKLDKEPQEDCRQPQDDWDGSRSSTTLDGTEGNANFATSAGLQDILPLEDDASDLYGDAKPWVFDRELAIRAEEMEKSRRRLERRNASEKSLYPEDGANGDDAWKLQELARAALMVESSEPSTATPVPESLSRPGQEQGSKTAEADG